MLSAAGGQPNIIVKMMEHIRKIYVRTKPALDNTFFFYLHLQLDN